LPTFTEINCVPISLLSVLFLLVTYHASYVMFLPVELATIGKF
jgi:hypothetical protein